MMGAILQQVASGHHPKKVTFSMTKVRCALVISDYDFATTGYICLLRRPIMSEIDA